MNKVVLKGLVIYTIISMLVLPFVTYRLVKTTNELEDLKVKHEELIKKYENIGGKYIETLLELNKEK